MFSSVLCDFFFECLKWKGELNEFLDTGFIPLYSLRLAPWMPHLKSGEKECWSHLTACHQLPAADSSGPCPWPGQPPGCLPDSAAKWSGPGWWVPALSPTDYKWGLGQNQNQGPLLLPCFPSYIAGIDPRVSAPGSDLEESLRMAPLAPGTKSSDHGRSSVSNDLNLPSVDARAHSEMSVLGENPQQLGGRHRTEERGQQAAHQYRAAAHHH